MKLDEIKESVLSGKKVCWGNDMYEVVLDKHGQWLIKCLSNGHCIGLTWEDNVTMNGKESEFYIKEK